MTGAGDSPSWSVLIGTDAGYAALLRAALRLQRENVTSQLLVFLGAEAAFPFRPRPSTILVPGMPAGVIASIPALEEVGVASRLASAIGLPGCHDGSVTELAELWLQSLDSAMIERSHIAVDSTETVWSAVTELGRRFQVPVVNIPGDAPP